MSSPAFAAFQDGWHARSEFAGEPACSLINLASVEPKTPPPGMMKIIIGWTASEGPLLWLNGALSGIPSVRLETGGTRRNRDVVLERHREPGMASLHAVMSAAELDELIDGVGLGHALAITVTRAGQQPERYLDAPGDRKLAVAMYRACVKSSRESPPAAHLPRPNIYLFQPVDYSECGYRHIFYTNPDRSFPTTITLYSSASGGYIVLERETVERGPHAFGRTRRKTPDRVDAAALFGGNFDLVDNVDYHLAQAQVDALIADLSKGNSRRVTLTSPQGETAMLEFGGPFGRASIAMLAACRAVKFGH